MNNNFETNLSLKETIYSVVYAAINEALSKTDMLQTVVDIKKNSKEAKVTEVKLVNSNYVVTAEYLDDSGTVIIKQSEVNGFSFVPSVNAIITVDFINSNEPYIVESTTLSNALINANEMIKFNGEDYGGLIIIQELTDKINALVDEIKSLKTFINTHTHQTVTSLGTPTVPAPLFTGNFSYFNKDDYENPEIVHGPIK